MCFCAVSQSCFFFLFYVSNVFALCVREQVRGSLSAFDASEGQFERSVPAALSVLAAVLAADHTGT